MDFDSFNIYFHFFAHLRNSFEAFCNFRAGITRSLATPIIVSSAKVVIVTSSIFGMSLVYSKYLPGLTVCLICGLSKSLNFILIICWVAYIFILYISRKAWVMSINNAVHVPFSSRAFSMIFEILCT